MAKTKKSKHIFLKIILGAISGIIGFLIVSLIDSPWEEIIIAAFVGSIAGIVDKSKVKIVIGILSCSGGFFLGSLLTIVLGEQLSLPLGAWGVAGASCGLIFGIYDRSILRAIFGFLLGLFAGLLAEGFEFLPLFIENIKLFDRQMITIVSFGLLLNFFAAFAQKPG